MKYAFSTLGCPDWSYEEIISVAKDLGFDGIEIRGIGRELYAPSIRQFSEDSIERTRNQLDKIGLAISCLSSDCRLNERFRIDDHMKCAQEYLELAGKLGVKYVRILADTSPAPTGSVDVKAIARDLARLAEYGSKVGAVPLVETNGYFCDTEKLLELLERADHENIGVLWDVHHPYRFNGEPVGETYEKLRGRIRNVHLKDSRMDGEDVEYQMMGYGDVPVQEALALLRNGGYDGYVSLEWLKRWQADLGEPGVVFPHFLMNVKR